MIWNDHSREIPKGSHAFLSPSTYSWCNYDDEKLTASYINKLAVSRGTALHELAEKLIRMKVMLPKTKETLNMFVNDSIQEHMESEKQLYYSKFCYGTADAIGLKDGILKIFDLKTGRHDASFKQLEIYAALFFLEYPHLKVDKIRTILRIYQHNVIRIEEPGVDVIVSLMDRIVRFSRILKVMEDKYDEGFETLWSGS